MAGPPGILGTRSASGFGNGLSEIFRWMKTVGGFRRTRYRGLDRTGLAGNLVATAYNLVRGWPRCWGRRRQLRKPGWHDLTMGQLCCAAPKRAGSRSRRG